MRGAAYTIEDQRIRAIEPYRYPVVLEQLEIPVLREGASTQRDHHRSASLDEPDAFLNCFGFDAPELRFAARVEDLGDRRPLLRFDDFIEIHKRPTEFLREQPADRRLAAGHEADQVYAGGAF